mmetsp:Transcript_11956/g.22890  ORF Transcript_11956/g.22890 Transcript_11956/m.22890 type:complete len:470 (-) Transcript_11956:87-1496(-)
MRQLSIFANHLIWHVFWDLSMLLYFQMLLQVITLGQNCFSFYLFIIGNGAYGLIFFCIRLFDPNLRKVLMRIFKITIREHAREGSVVDEDLSVRLLAYNYSYEEAEGQESDDLFTSLKKMFILDSLTAFNIAYSMKRMMQFQTIQQTESSNSSSLLIKHKAEEVIYYDDSVLRRLYKDKLIEQMTYGSQEHAFKLVEYSPSVFERIRQAEGITLDELIKAFHPAKNMMKLNNLDERGGRSGSFVYRTYDSRFIIKTISSKEKVLMLNTLLENYIARVMNRDSMLVRILGVFMLQCIDNFSVDLLIMENISCVDRLPIFKVDLKGSTLGRLDNKTGLPRSPSENFMKDVDFLNQVEKLNLEDEDAERFVGAVEKDVRMLVQHGIMDYSLFGTYFIDQELPTDNKYCFRHKGKPGCFYALGIIDILQGYNSNKKCEHWLKRIFKRASPDALSSVNPLKYGERFLRFCNTIK